MTFTSQHQQARACRAILGPYMWHLFTHWPTDELLGVADGLGSSSEVALARMAMGLWNRDQRATFSQVLHVLDNNNLGRVAKLLTLLAQSRPELLDEWLDEIGVPA